MFSRFVFLASFAALSFAPAMAQNAPAAPVFSEVQQKEIRSLVRDYILKNPEILQEAMVELERRSAVAQENERAKALGESGATIADEPLSVTTGNPKGDVTLVEFFDYNCGYCKKALGEVQALLKADPKIRFVARDFPVLGADSLATSRIALATKKQFTPEKAWEFHVRLMEMKGRVTADRAQDLAREMGADTVRLEKDASGEEIHKAIQSTVALGDRLGLTGTPSFVIGNEVVQGALNVAEWQKNIQNVRKCGKTAC
jgi:protein-disulfide isomerase